MFKKYPSLTNHYENKFIDMMVLNGLTQGEWVAREKIHGTNFSFMCDDGATVNCAKRTGEVLPSESFYGYEVIKGRYYASVINIWNMLKKTGMHEDGLEIQVFGEFAGEGIQKNIDYGKKEFYVFDIIVNGLLIPDTLTSIIARFSGFTMAPLLGWGTYDQLKRLPLNFVSVVPTMTNIKYSSPSLPHEIDSNSISAYIGAMTGTYSGERQYVAVEAPEDAKNLAEGYVLKPCFPKFNERGERIALKCKSPKFSEKKNSSGATFKAPSSLNEFDAARLDLLTQYLNENRVESVLSKLDRSTLNAKAFGRVTGLTVQDALEEIERNHGLFENNFEDPALAKKLFVAHATSIIRGMWQDIISPA